MTSPKWACSGTLLPESLPSALKKVGGFILLIALVLCSILFGVGHFYKGPAGIIDSTVSGLVYGSVYLLSNRNLWMCIFTHGFVDTLGLLYFYFGFYSS